VCGYLQVYNLGGIQKLCDALQENPTWTVAHLAAYFSLHDTFQHPVIIRYSAHNKNVNHYEDSSMTHIIEY
jgi:hypothetical protein